MEEQLSSTTSLSWLQRGEEEAEDPDSEDSDADSPGTIPEIWRLLPHLRQLPDKMVKKLPLSAMFQLNRALAEDSKSSAKLSVSARLTHNARALVEKPIVIEAGTDNRKSRLHAARFLGGASCSGQELWLLARRILGDKGVKPLGNYDMDSIGCGGSVTPKGWDVIHNPGSGELKLKLFYMPNVGSSGLSGKKISLQDGEEALNIGENMRDIADVESFKIALNTAREAQAVALPWNRSIAAIVGFMLNTGYLQEDLGGNPKRAAILTEFVDYVFGRNALNWENGAHYLSTDDLAHVWTTWKGKRSALVHTKTAEKFKKPHKEKSNICKRFNNMNCPKQTEKECKSFYGFRLRHVCNYQEKGQKMCEQDHPRKEHK